MRLPIGLDFETEAITARPDYPPKPVGLAVKEPGIAGQYLAFGHPTENNCTKAHVKKFLRTVYRSGRPIIFHHSKFDVDVAEVHLDLPPPPWHLIHDSMFQAFLYDPHAYSLELKKLADQYLDMPPTEQEELRDWILANVPNAKRAKTKWGAHIAKAPGKLAGKYAIGDVVRTVGLHKFYYPYLKETGMLEAYDRERRLMPILLANERRGMLIADRRLNAAIKTWDQSLENTDRWLRRKLKAKDLDIDSGQDLADALEHSGYVHPDDWIYTAPSKTYPEGKRSTSKDNIEKCIKDPEILRVLGYRSKLANGIRNFARPWLDMARNNNGHIHTNWNQVRQANEKGKFAGARTGRLSSNPNFMNVPNIPDYVVFNKKEAALLADKADKADVKIIQLPTSLRGKLCALPNLRDFIKPDKGGRLNNRDYSQQELRILGHYEGGVLQDAYNDNPTLDFHQHAQTEVNIILSKTYKRKPIKTTNFGLIYGMGLAKLAKQMDSDYGTAKELKTAILKIFPGLSELIRELRKCAKNDEPITTWGGRQYYVEPGRIVDGAFRTFEYKLLNQLIQGSAADCTKQAIINYDEIDGPGRLLLTVHDEIMTTVTKMLADLDMQNLREAMEAVQFDVPMLSDGKISTQTWARCTKFKEAA